MTCAASGFPPPTFTWTKGGIPITVADDGSDGMLTLSDVGPLFPGMYTCTATSMIPGDPAEDIPPATSTAEFFAAGKLRQNDFLHLCTFAHTCTFFVMNFQCISVLYKKAVHCV